MTAAAAPLPVGRSLAELKAYWQSQPFLIALDIGVEHLDRGYAKLSMRRTNVTVGGIRNSINGGVVASYAELVARVALSTALEEGESIEGTVDLGVSYLSSARGDPTLAEARLLRKGGRLCVCDVEIRDGANGAINAKARVTNSIARRPRRT